MDDLLKSLLANDVKPQAFQWCIKNSFLQYIMRSNGQCSVTDGATLHHGRTFSYKTSGAPRVPRRFEFEGDVRFLAHGGRLFVRVANPWVTFRYDDEAVLCIADPVGSNQDSKRVVMATSSTSIIEAEFSELTLTDVVLTDEGSDLFGNVYPAGTLFEPISIRF